MKKIGLFITLFLLSLTQVRLAAQTAGEDSIDVLHYNLILDMGNETARQLKGVAEITFVLTHDCDAVSFDLICDAVSPISIDGVETLGFNYIRDDAFLRISLPGGQAGDTHVVSVSYVTNGYVESYDFGGLHMDANVHYNLGAVFMLVPHVFGRSWYPCRDNFYDKATYRLEVTSKPGWRAICSGLRQSETPNPDGSNTSVWVLDHPSPTYIVGISSANWHTIEREYEGLYGTYPALIGYGNEDSSRVYAAFDILEDVIPMFERAFGPYRWDRVGYIATPRGSMEHASNIALADACIADNGNACQMTICHELGHAWFGNLITCATDGDMWINEGGATFCEEVATEAAFGRRAATSYYINKLCDVLRLAHVSDYGYRSLSGMDQMYTYGTTTYQKGALVWHSLRGIMGDSLFYSCMNRLFESCAFGNLDAESLRDSLSLYSGMDLNGFFDFHVFTPGFVDYAIDNLEVEGNDATLTLRQQLVGTTHYAYGNRVPVTFFSYDLQQSHQWMLFDDSIATQTFHLPFVAAFAVVDYNQQISDACTGTGVSLKSNGVQTLSSTYCKIHVVDAYDYPHAWAYVEHHFVHPTGDTVEGVVRMANRYWEVKGFIPWEGEYKGRFLYNLGSSGGESAMYLDAGFYDNHRTLDSLALLYRPNSHEPWRMVSRQRMNSSTINNGYFVARLLPGQYTLAVVDTNLVSIPSPQRQEKWNLKIYPNPATTRDMRVELEGYDKKFDLIFFDSTGRKVLQMNDVGSGDTIRHNLPAGSYIVLIKNNFISLHSQIIVQ